MPQLSWTSAIYGAEDIFLGEFLPKLKAQIKKEREKTDSGMQNDAWVYAKIEQERYYGQYIDYKNM